MPRMFSHSSICMFFPRRGAVLAKALFVGRNRNPLELTQKKGKVYFNDIGRDVYGVHKEEPLNSQALWGGWLWTQGGPGKPQQWESVASMRVFCHHCGQPCSICLCYQSTQFSLSRFQITRGISLAQFTFHIRPQVTSQPVDCPFGL